MVRLLLLLLFLVFLGRAVWRFLQGVVEGATRQGGRPGTPSRGVQMVRDPVCGTFVVPARAYALGEGDRQVFFCSERCREQYRAGAR
ncbi:MAG TPA: hypothetical protein VNE16_07625 [Vicinamibacterales bacterium]|nr:hypothetical protein [Vicinamibacterales bacterium]